MFGFFVRPKEPTIHFKEIIVCSFYCAPSSRKKSQLIQHITINHSSLKLRYRDTFFMIGGDRNDLDIKRILDISLTLHSLNTKPTHGKKNIDVIVTGMVHLFEESVIILNVTTDIPDGQPGGGKRSDHPIVYSQPHVSMLKHPEKEVIIKKTRRLDDEKIRKVGQWIQPETWEAVFNANSASGMAEKLPELVFRKLDEICPVEEIKLTKISDKVVSKALQDLARQRLREYNKHGNSQRFKEIKRKQKEIIKVEAIKQLDKQLDKAKGKGMSWMKEAKWISARPWEDDCATFTLPEHLDENLTPEQSAERIARYLSKISQEYKPIEEDTLSPQLQSRLDNEVCHHPAVREE